jgi:transketolase
MPSSLSPEFDRRAIDVIRGLAMDAPLKANSGHQGTAMALAPLGHVLFSRVMRFDPQDPEWPDRDRFVLSNGHASILQYSLLFLAGTGLELSDLEAFRQWESATPGHPERGHTAGVEVTTGPLGQGFGDSVGMAIAERSLRTRFGAEVMDHHTFVIVGDGCLQEGISHEAASLAGHLGLGRLVVIYDDNLVTIDGSTELSSSDDAAARFRAYGWHVMELQDIANDCDALEAAIREAMSVEDRPSFLRLRTHIGYPSPDHTDDYKAHGLAFDADDVSRTKAVMGIPDSPFWAPDEIVDAYRGLGEAPRRMER